MIQIQWSWIAGGAALLAAGAVVSCGNEVGPDERISLRPSFNAAPTFTATLSPTRSDSAFGPVTLGSYPNPTLAVIEVSGVLDQYYSTSPGWNFPPPIGDLRGTLKGQMDAGGEFNGSAYQCAANVAVLFNQSGGKVFCDYANQKPLSSVWTDTSVVRGDGTARWYRGPVSWLVHCDGTGRPPCYTYTGSFSVSVTPVPAELTLSASRYVVYPGKGSVTFTAGRTPAQFGSRTVPFTIQNWTWKPDSGGSAITPCAATTNPCTYSPASSGTMQVTALVNGVSQTESRHVKKLCNPTGNPLLDSLPVLDMLSALLTASGDPNLPNQATRREQYGVLRCQNGECGSDVIPLALPCGSAPPTRLDTIAGLVGTAHDHPFYPVWYDSVAHVYRFRNMSVDSLPDICPRSDTTKHQTRGSGPFPSGSDIEHVSSYNNFPPFQMPHWVVDPEHIYAIPAGVMSDSARRAGTKTSSRGVGSCALY